MESEKQRRYKTIIEMAITYIAVILIIMFSSSIVSLGNSTAVKMFLTVGVYAAAAAVVFIVLYLRKIPLSELGFTKVKINKQLLTAVLIFAVTFCAAVIIPLALGINKADVLHYKYRSVYILIFYMFYDFFCVGFGEELIFRGYFYSRIKTVSQKAYMPMIISALLFGLLHYPNTLNIANVIATTGLGLVYGFCRWKIKSCSLLSLSVAHGMHDAVISLLSYIL